MAYRFENAKDFGRAENARLYAAWFEETAKNVVKFKMFKEGLYVLNSQGSRNP
jgi:hypothetical protein